MPAIKGRCNPVCESSSRFVNIEPSGYPSISPKTRLLWAIVLTISFIYSIGRLRRPLSHLLLFCGNATILSWTISPLIQKLAGVQQRPAEALQAARADGDGALRVQTNNPA